MAGLTQQQILQQIGRTGWRFTGAVRDETETGDVPTTDEFGSPATSRGQKPTGNKIYGIVGPNGEPDEIVVKQVQTARAATGSPGSTDPSQPAQPDLFELVKGPSNEPPKPNQNANDPKGTRKTQLIDMPGGSKATIEVVADGLGNWSPDTSKQPVPYIAAEGKPPPEPTTSATLKQIPQLVNGAWTWVDNPNYVPPKADKPDAAVVNTTAEFIPDPEKPTSFIKNPNYRTPDQALTTGERAVDTATGSNAQATSDAALAKAQAEASRAQIQYEEALRLARQAPTDAQAQQALATAQRGLDLANQQLEASIKQSAALDPLRVEQAQATLEQTRQLTQKGLQGDLYGRREQLQQIRDLLASGDIKTPEEADAMTAALNRGTTVYDAMKQAQADRQAARTQDVSNRNQLASTFGSTFTSGLSTLSDMNKYAPVGSTAGADAFVALLNMSQQRLKDYEVAPAQETNYLAPLTPSPVGNMVSAAQQQMATAQPQTNAAQPITINIGSGAASNPQGPTPNLLPAGATGTASDPHAQPFTGGGPMSSSGDMLARSAAQQTPATNGEVISTLFPNMAKRFGLLTE